VNAKLLTFGPPGLQVKRKVSIILLENRLSLIKSDTTEEVKISQTQWLLLTQLDKRSAYHYRWGTDLHYKTTTTTRHKTKSKGTSQSGEPGATTVCSQSHIIILIFIREMET